jgi:hypothetical protein
MQVIEWTRDWESRERFWIAFYRWSGAPLLNVAAGGLDMAHVGKAAQRYPNYAWAMRFCGRRKNVGLAKLLSEKARAARLLGKMAHFDIALKEAIEIGHGRAA